ncbi:hypothetical protein M5W83_01715 [Paenibacillus thiaminolyticus]|uniref:Uncharacterized protein n=1 Tax=Paenibacillus thiaminolyticus TaxID=49283 RepID=A0AAP9DT39_PANTH|nr:hypothetical protein [Paenibacillus thiaminolyticus]MCY9538440.1 hypothetical protein [Paenibacillus thiaminolyticus]MCY9601177.1 hypothetical protein [Paenibacillus thiaminolyticus]MCY9605895.1 hypothetical protein [Paenibacillus thiaminolyticus]MCY9611226.1 hypothetical protein [Paenibacillus thiaminolyticus]MCY9617455.1 hypothetical protein [Paenibacillus thiaminolyticus]
MMDETMLDRFRQEGTKVRVVRDMIEANDVTGTVVAWSGDEVMIRKRNRRIVKLSRSYLIQPFSDPRPELEEWNSGPIIEIVEGEA